MKIGDIVNWRNVKYKIIELFVNPYGNGAVKLQNINDKKKIMWTDLDSLIKENKK